MIGIGRLYRQIVINHLQQRLKAVNAFYIVYYKGLSATELDILRRSLKQTNARLFVTKDSLAKLVLKELNWGNLLNLIEGQVGFVFVESDPTVTSRILVNFAKEHQNLTFGGGILRNQILTKSDLIALASLPSRDILLAKMAGGIKAPLTSLVMTLNQTLQKVVLVLRAIAEKNK